MDVNNKTIVVTGAASGIGRSLAIVCARRGASIALADRDLDGVKKVVERVGEELQPGRQCTTHALDVSQLDEWQGFRQSVLQEHGCVDGVINNAGISFNGSVEDTEYENYEKVMSINFMGMVYGSKEFLPLLKERPEAFIANVSSVFGLYPMKNQSAYCASKFAIRGFTEVLAQELKDSSVLISSVHPGHIGTNILKNAKQQGNVMSIDMPEEDQDILVQAFKAMGLAPGKAAETILDGLKKRKSRIMVGKDAVRGEILSRYFPTPYINSVNKAAL